MVSTVGKNWASLYSFDLPYGDPGATVLVSPPLTNLYGNLPSGPIYFDASVTANPALAMTSVDGGVLFDISRRERTRSPRRRTRSAINGSAPGEP